MPNKRDEQKNEPALAIKVPIAMGVPDKAPVTKSNSRVTDELGDVNLKYEVEEEEIGHGHYGVVRLCKHRETGEKFAVKTIQKAKVHRLELLRREIEILRTVDHPTIIKLVDVYEDAAHLHLVTELCMGGELFDRIIEMTESEAGHFSERDAARIIHKILSAIEYIHNEHNICHRDLKPENFLFKYKDSLEDLKIIDFGLSRFEDTSHMTTRVGTPYYIAPEVLEKKYDSSCDLWSIGVITFILLCGYPPFYGDNDAEIFRSIQSGKFAFSSPEWDTISDDAKDLIMKLLLKNPKARLSASKALVHPWFDSALEGSAAAADMQDNIRHLHHRLRRFVGSCTLKKMALNIIAQNLQEEDIGHLRKVFNSIDIDGNGVITLDELHKVVQAEATPQLQEEALTMLVGMDMDSSQTVEYNEFLAATMARAVWSREAYMKQAFDHFDYDKKGYISMEDLRRCLPNDDACRQVLGEVDSNADGVISFEEFSAMMQHA